MATGVKRSSIDDTERFRMLSRWFSMYDCTTHNHKVVDWNFEDAPSNESSRFMYESRSMIPAVHDQFVSLRSRRPDSSQNIGVCIVEKFTALLFDEERRPQIVVGDGRDQVKEDFVRMLVEKTSLFDKFVDIRNLGGSSSSVFVYISFYKSKPVINYVESRHCIPIFDENDDDELQSVTIQKIYSSTEEVVEDKKTGKTKIVDVERWWRCDITKNEYVYYDNPEFKEGKDPEFNEIARLTHNLDMFPGIWIRNRRKVGFDSIPDYYGAEDLICKVDMLTSQLNRAGLYNGDPTMHIASDKEVPSAKVGSFNTVETSANGKVGLVSIDSDSIKALVDIIAEDISAIQRICKVDLSSFAGLAGRDRVTATEVSKMQMDMFAQASVLRGKYGKAVCSIIHKVIEMCRDLNKRTIILCENGLEEEKVFKVSDEFVPTFDAKENIKLKWKKYISVTPSEMKVVVDAIAVAIKSKTIDRKTACQIMAMYIPIDIDQDEFVDRVNAFVKESEQIDSNDDNDVDESSNDGQENSA